MTTVLGRRRRSVQDVALTSTLRAATGPVGVLPARAAVFSALDTVASTPVLWTNRLVSVERVDAGGVPAEFVRAKTVKDPERTVLHFHGGGFVFGSPATHRALAESLSVTCRSEVLLPAFRHPPAVSPTEMIADCLASYRWLAERVDPAQIVLSGDSSGGNLAFATLLAVRDEGLPLPAALVGLSAWLDLAHEQPAEVRRDALIPAGFARRIAQLCFADGAPAEVLRPLERDVTGLPPVLLQTGVHDPMRDGNERMHRRLSASGVSCELQLWPGRVHAFQVFGRVLPEARAALREFGRFARSTTGEVRS